MKTMQGRLKTFLTFLNGSDGSLAKRAIRSGFWVSIANAGVAGLALTRSVFLARLLTPEMFGLMAVAMIALRMANVLTQTGVNAALIHRKESFAEAKDTAFTLLCVRGFALAAVLCLASPFVARFYEQPLLTPMLIAVSTAFVFNGFLNINTIAREKELDFKRLAYLDQAAALLNTAIVVILAYLLRSVWALVLGYISAALVTMLLSYILVPGRPRFAFDRKIASDLFRYGKFITGVSITLFIASELDNAFIGKVLGAEALGYYVVAYMLANLPATHISKLASKIMFPAYSKLQDDRPALQAAYLKVLALVASLAFAASALLFITAPLIIDVVYGDKWLPAVGALQILCVFGAVRSVASVHGYLLNGIGRPNIDFCSTSIRLIVIAALIYPMAVTFAIPGIAVAVTIALSVQLFIGTFFVGRYVGLPLRKIASTVAKPLMHAALIVGVVWVLRLARPEPSLANLVIALAVGAGLLVLLNARSIGYLLTGVSHLSR